MESLEDLKEFSSEEVSVDGDDILLSITVPVPEDYEVRYLDADGTCKKTKLAALPPVDVRLSRPTDPATDPVDFVAIATIRCFWLRFKLVSIPS
jgi:hypothetical protein